MAGGRQGPDLDPITGQPVDTRDSRIETKEFFRTSEFAVATLGVLGLALTTVILDAFTAHDAWPLMTFIIIGYVISRGLAKAGTAHPFAGRGTIELFNRREDNQHQQPQFYQQAPQYQPVPQYQQPVAHPGQTQPVAPPPGAVTQQAPVQQPPVQQDRY